MSPAATTRQLLARNTADLPAELLQEVLDYVQFLRLKRLPQAAADVLRTELLLGQQHEWQHLEEEFADFEQRFPRP
jgi:hypothetical protein